MKTKPIKILDISKEEIICEMSNGEIRSINLNESLQDTDKYKKIVLKSDVIINAKIGDVGQIYWAEIAVMKDEDGNNISCEYDLSPEFFYENSSVVEVI